NGPEGGEIRNRGRARTHGGETMAISLRRWQIAGLILAVILTAGCNPLLAPYWIFGMFGAESKLPPHFAVGAKGKDRDKDDPVRVMILVSTGLETRPEFLRADRDLCNMVARRLQQGCKDNKENVQVIPASQVEKFKDQHPNWRTLTSTEIGEHFHADYVIEFEITSLSLYEVGSHNTLYQGRAQISVSVTDVHDPDNAKAFEDEIRCEYPKGRPIPAD